MLFRYNLKIVQQARIIEYASAAMKTLRRIDSRTARRIRQKITQLAIEPEALGNSVIPLRGEDGLKRLRVGDWRVIFTETLIVLSIVRIAPRGSAYEDRS